MSDVSREAQARIDAFAATLRDWNRRINLVAPASLPNLERRHIADSLQLLEHAPEGWDTWADLGSGGGFPGVVIALVHPARRVDLVEADLRKAAFLRQATRNTAARVHAHRIENLAPLGAGVVSARALAPLPQLLDLVSRHLAQDGIALLPKGRRANDELAAARRTWHFDCETAPSRTDPEGVILKIRNIERA